MSYFDQAMGYWFCMPLDAELQAAERRYIERWGFISAPRRDVRLLEEQEESA